MAASKKQDLQAFMQALQRCMAQAAAAEPPPQGAAGQGRSVTGWRGVTKHK